MTESGKWWTIDRPREYVQYHGSLKAMHGDHWVIEDTCVCEDCEQRIDPLDVRWILWDPRDGSRMEHVRPESFTRLPNLLESCGCPTAIVRDEGHQEGCSG